MTSNIKEKSFAYITNEEAAELLGILPGTLTLWRATKKGPTFYKIGKVIKYKVSDIEEFISSKKVEMGRD